MSPEILVGLAIFGGLAYFLIFHSPQSDRVYSSRSEEELGRLKTLLENEGIIAFIKNAVAHRYIVGKGGPTPMADPSLHVANVKDLQRAREIVNTATRELK